MKRMLPTVAAALFSVLPICPTLAQQLAQARVAKTPERSGQFRPTSAAAPLYQRHETWLGFLLKQFNPDDVDYGVWLEQRRRALLEASLRNPYFKYSAFVTVALGIVAMLYVKQFVDHRRSMWITAEMMTDLYNHDAYSRQVAHEAIKKYNDHIERCNRAVEAAERGVSVGGIDSEVDRFRAELQSVTAERDSCKRECELAKSDLAEKERLLADLSLRLDALAKKSHGNRDQANGVDVRIADQKLVQHINNLQEQLYAEKRENKRLKGA